MKTKYRKILGFFCWLITLAGIGISLAFVSRSSDEMRATRLDIRISNNEENFFIDEKDVRDFFTDRGDVLLGSLYQNINIPDLEKGLNAHPAVENAEVAATVNGTIKINVKQRTPLVRVINKSGESYYIDNRARLMPLNEHYSARVLVASGEIEEPYARRSMLTVTQIAKNPLYGSLSVLDDVYAVAKYISADSLLVALIHHLYINRDQEIELFPAIGQHRIVLGNSEDLHLKFNKLKLFYTQGLNSTNGWLRYSTINLKFKNLVVCTKK